LNADSHCLGKLAAGKAAKDITKRRKHLKLANYAKKEPLLSGSCILLENVT
jgi:hypothetical protein